MESNERPDRPPADDPPLAAPPPAQPGDAADAAPPPPADAAPPPPADAPPPPPFAEPPRAAARPLVRTRDPRVIAGVCGGIARATNTDPLLWRVILAVLVFFNGVGAAVYLLLWLLLPLEDESASPLESLFGRGKSSTSPVVTVLLGVLGVISLSAALSEGFESVLAFAAIIGGLILLLRRAGFPSTAFTGWGAPGPVAAPAGGYGTPAASYAGPTTAHASTAPPASYYGAPTSAAPPYGAPFAPHGPYAPSGATADQPTAPLPPYPPGQPDQPLPPGPPMPPDASGRRGRGRRRERSVLGRLTFALMCFVLAGLVLVDLTGTAIEFGTYAATALAVVAAGLIVGAWYGRSRWLIALGIVLSILVLVGHGSREVDQHGGLDQHTVWTPTSVTELQPRYEPQPGDAVLDLRQIDFTEHDEHISIELGVGNLQVLLPPKVDATVTSKVGVGSSQVFGERGEGLGLDHTTGDNGVDGTGGGSVVITASVGIGDLEVTR